MGQKRGSTTQKSATAPKAKQPRTKATSNARSAQKPPTEVDHLQEENVREEEQVSEWSVVSKSLSKRQPGLPYCETADAYVHLGHTSYVWVHQKSLRSLSHVFRETSKPAEISRTVAQAMTSHSGVKAMYELRFDDNIGLWILDRVPMTRLLKGPVPSQPNLINRPILAKEIEESTSLTAEVQKIKDKRYAQDTRSDMATSKDAGNIAPASVIAAYKDYFRMGYGCQPQLGQYNLHERVEHIVAITKIADYYGSLPCVRHFLCNALMSFKAELIDAISIDVVTFTWLGAYLKNAFIFHEAATHYIGQYFRHSEEDLDKHDLPWNCRAIIAQKCTELREAVTATDKKLMFHKVHHEVGSTSVEYERFIGFWRERIVAQIKACEEGRMEYVDLYRDLYHRKMPGGDFSDALRYSGVPVETEEPMGAMSMDPITEIRKRSSPEPELQVTEPQPALCDPMIPNIKDEDMDGTAIGNDRENDDPIITPGETVDARASEAVMQDTAPTSELISEKVVAEPAASEVGMSADRELDQAKMEASNPTTQATAGIDTDIENVSKNTDQDLGPVKIRDMMRKELHELADFAREAVAPFMKNDSMYRPAMPKWFMCTSIVADELAWDDDIAMGNEDVMAKHAGQGDGCKAEEPIVV